MRSILSPCQKTVKNKDGGIIAEKVSEGKGNFGYNALTDVFEDVVKTGIIDPTKVARTALQNAVNVASLMLTSDALVAAPQKIFQPQRGKGNADAAGRGYVLS